MATVPVLELSPGTVFARDFRIVRPLSSGGMGVVYVAEQLSTGKERALKLMHPHLVRDARLRERFVQEARVGAAIKSEHVVQVVGAGVDDATGTPWLAMELLAGQDLAAYVAHQGPLSAGELLELFRQICHALGAAHGAGIVHRDLKPENVFLARSERADAPVVVKVLDFGIAKVVADAGAALETSGSGRTQTVGTPVWMAPEQSDPRATIGPATDVWALGLLAFWALTGKVYWKTATDPLASMHAVLRELLFDPIVAPTERAAELGVLGRIPPGFDAWFAAAVARDADERYANASDARAALRGALPADPVALSAPIEGAAVLAMAPTVPTPLAVSNAFGPTKVSPVLGGTPAAVAVATGLPSAAPPAAAPSKSRAPLAAAGALALVAALGLAWFRFGGASADGATSPAGSGAAPTAPTDARPGPSSEAPAPHAPTVAPTAAPVSKGPAKAPPAGSGAAPAPAAAKPFDAGAAHAALQQKGSTAKVHCKNRSGPRVITATVFFAPAGNVQRTQLTPISAAATETGGCVTMLLMSARVPPFASDKLESVTTTVGVD